MPRSQTGHRYWIWDDNWERTSVDCYGRKYTVIERTIRRFRIQIPFDELWYERIVLPVERFVTYEASDVAWLLPLGLARIQREDIMAGTRFNLRRLTGEDENGIVDRAGFELRYADAIVEGVIPEFLDLGELYVR